MGTEIVDASPPPAIESSISPPPPPPPPSPSVLARYCGVRKDEIALADGAVFNLDNTSRAALVWLINGVEVPSPTREQLCNLGPEDMAIFLPATAKNDQFGFHFAGTPVWIGLTADPLDARTALAEYEISRPVYGAARALQPLFCVSPGEPLRQSVVDRLLEGLLVKAIGPDLAHRHSFHSHRITIATKLRAAGTSSYSPEAPA